MVYDDQFRENLEKDDDFDEMIFKDLVSRPVHVAQRIAATQKFNEIKDEKGEKIRKLLRIFHLFQIFFVKEQGLLDKALSEGSDKHANKANRLTPYLLLFALSFHGIFEGIAVGLQSSFSQCLNLLIAVCLHKWAEALTLVNLIIEIYIFTLNS